MLDRKRQHSRRGRTHDTAAHADEGRWIVMDTATGDNNPALDPGAIAARAYRVEGDAAHPVVEDERQVARRILTLLRAHMRASAKQARPLPAYLRTLAKLLHSAPREPLVRAIAALHQTRRQNGRVFVLTEEVRAGPGSRLAWDLRRRGVHALLVTRHTPRSATSVDPLGIDTLLRSGDVVMGMHGNSPAYAGVREAAMEADALFVIFGDDADHAEPHACAIACGSGNQVLDARLFFMHLICTVLQELESPKRRGTRARPLRQVS
jgi:hypothetical protein